VSASAPLESLEVWRADACPPQLNATRGADPHTAGRDPTNLDALEAVEETTEDDHLRTDALLQEWDELVVELEPLAAREAEGSPQSARR
jgi:hypothetical protein